MTSLMLMRVTAALLLAGRAAATECTDTSLRLPNGCADILEGCDNTDCHIPEYAMLCASTCDASLIQIDASLSSCANYCSDKPTMRPDPFGGDRRLAEENGAIGTPVFPGCHDPSSFASISTFGPSTRSEPFDDLPPLADHTNNPLACDRTYQIVCANTADICRPVPVVSQAQGDPHTSDGRGGRFDFKGKDGMLYNILSAALISVNAKFKHLDFRTMKRLIHGSFMTAVYVTTKESSGRIVNVEYDASRAVFLNVQLDGAEPTRYQAPVSLSLGNVTIVLKDRKMTIATSEWAVAASSKVKNGIIRGDSCATGKCFLNIEIKPLADVGHGNVPPHGLIGQAIDGGDVSVVGATDKYTGPEYTTSAMGEGAIEGTASDYEMEHKFSSTFKYARWGLEMAKPRNVSALTGVKVQRAQVSQGMAAASAVDDFYMEQAK